MTRYGGLSLEMQFGSETANKLTVIYGDLLDDIQQQRSFEIVPRHLRLIIVDALVSGVERGETNFDCLKEAALFAVARHDEGDMGFEV